MNDRLIFPVRYRTPEFVCLHEAGHAAAGIFVNARVVEMELYLGPPPYGRTRIDPETDEQQKIVALGGFAVERRLWEEGRLLLPSGCAPSEKEMLDESANNADRDRISHFGGDYREPNGYWPHDFDMAFMNGAQVLGRKIDMSLVERLASALLAENFIDEARIRKIVTA